MADENYYQSASSSKEGIFEHGEQIKSHVIMSELSELPDVIMSEDGDKAVETIQTDEVVVENHETMEEEEEQQREEMFVSIENNNVEQTKDQDETTAAVEQIDVQENATANCDGDFSTVAMTSETVYNKSEPSEASMAPVFKICKVVRRADGSTECVETNMREIAVADRAVVYRAMLEKFPEIVKQKVASVLTPYQLKKIQANHDPNETSTEIEAVPSVSTCLNNDCNQNKLVSILRSPPLSTSSGVTNNESEIVELTSHLPLASSTPAVENNTEQPKSTKRGNIMARYRKIAPKPLWATNANSGVVMSTSNLQSSCSAAKETAHVCKAERYYECGGCFAHFKTELDFLKHAAISYLKVSPHLFAANCTIECALCGEHSVQLTDLMDAREHLRQHGTTMMTKCETCSQHIARDHMYATKSDSESGSDLNKVINNNSQTPRPSCEQVVAVDDEVYEDNAEESADADKNGAEERPEAAETNPCGGPKMYKCRYCYKQFSKRNICKLHVFAHLGIRPISCPLCGMSFHRKQSLSHHMQVHMQVKPKKDVVDSIEELGETSTNDQSTSDTLVSLDGDTSRSALAILQSKKCRRKRVTDVHNPENGGKIKMIRLDSVSQPKPQGPVLCELCGLELKNARRLNCHQYRVHNQPKKRPISKDVTPLPCQECGKLCRGVSALKSHQRMLCGKKEVLCEICGKMYPAGGRALSNHRYQTHRWRGSDMEKASWERLKNKKTDGDVGKDSESGSVDTNSMNGEVKSKKPFEPKKCELCGFVATYSTSMRAHLVNKHKYPKIRARIYNADPVKCEKCGTICKGLPALKLHEIRFCLGGKTLTCPICGKTFQDRKKYSSHKYNHKWWGSEKERKWRERRKALGIPRKKQAKDEVDNSGDIESNLNDTEIQVTLQDNESGTLEEIGNGEEENGTEEAAETNLIIDSNSPLLQLISANHGLDPQSVQFVMGEAEEGEQETVQNLDQELELETPVEGTVEDGVDGNSQIVNFYQVLVTNSNGQRVLALVPNLTGNI